MVNGLPNISKIIINPEYDNWNLCYNFKNDMSQNAGEYFDDIFGPEDVYGHEEEIMKPQSYRPIGFNTIADFFEAIRDAPYVKLTPNVWDYLDYSETSSKSTRESALRTALYYSLSNPAYYKRLYKVAEGMSEGVPLPSPVVLKQGTWYQILSGNRRLLAAKILEVEIVMCHIVDIPKA